MSTDLQAQWNALNVRQQTYLRALYECDQAEEAQRRREAARGFYDRRPASVWRWQQYGPIDPPSGLYTALKKAKLVDPGTGATWQALEARKLVQCRYTKDVLGADLLEVQITAAGRKLVRAAMGVQAPKAPPKGQLRERQWAALARLYAAGDDGLTTEFMQYGEYGTSFRGFDWMQTLLRLREYKPQALMEEYDVWRSVKQMDGTRTHREYRMRLTQFGREFYEREWSYYRELYPNVTSVRDKECHSLASQYIICI